ncbi:hypothetical protein BJV82DRAFT_158983 [Fennellomyces sp. T-0311]|nr:hypothetical protein BJV82DRAFT_158983 [Fennellomyces sp. T-0311]
MDDTWNRNEFKDELEALLNIQLPISQSKIQSLRNLAIKHPKHQNYLVQCVCKFIETAPPDYRLPGLYLIDAIVRRCKEDKDEERVASEYRKRFSVILKDGALTGLFHPCLEKDKVMIFHNSSF